MRTNTEIDNIIDVIEKVEKLITTYKQMKAKFTSGTQQTALNTWITNKITAEISDSEIKDIILAEMVVRA